MAQFDNNQSLSAPLFGAFQIADFAMHKVHRNNEHTGTLFWSLERLFGCYHRVMVVLNLPSEDRPFLEADIESFIIRFRIVLNDIAYLLWQMLPPNTRNLKGPKGSTHPKNKEVSIRSLSDFFSNEKDAYPEFATVFSNASNWINLLIDHRDNIVHYKSKVLIFGFETLAFAFFSAGYNMPLQTTPEGGQRVVTQPVAEFINGQMLSLHEFMHSELASAILAYYVRLGLISTDENISQMWISCFGIETFKRFNGIKT